MLLFTLFPLDCSKGLLVLFIDLQYDIIFLTRCTRGVRVAFSRARMQSSNSARMNKSDFTTETTF